MGGLGLRPILVGAVGPDFADYRSWLERHGVDTESVHVSEVAAHGPLRVHDRPGREPDRLVLPRRDERGARDRAGAGGRPRGRPRPRPDRGQRPRGDGPAHRRVPVRGSRSPPTPPSSWRGWTAPRSASSSTARRTCSPTSTRPRSPSRRPAGPATRSSPGRHPGHHPGAEGVRIERKGEATIQVPTPGAEGRPDRRRRRFPGRLPGRAGLGAHPERCAQVGSLLATYVIETVGTQEYELARRHFLERIARPTATRRPRRSPPHICLARP